MNLGNFNTQQFGTVAVQLLLIYFFACTILIMIVMLNLLIAIISGSYSRIVDN